MKSEKILSKAKIKKILGIFNDLYPEPKTELNFKTPFELLVATILSAQTTDRQVNKITASLFSKWHTPEEFAELPLKTLENEIKSCGLFKNKAKNIIAASKLLVEQYGSKSTQHGRPAENTRCRPENCNVVLANAFKHDVIAVDTHVFRVSNRLGLANSTSVDGTEKQLMANIPAGMRNDAHHWLILHGRNSCKAKNPKCPECPVHMYCHSTNSV